MQCTHLESVASTQAHVLVFRRVRARYTQPASLSVKGGAFNCDCKAHSNTLHSGATRSVSCYFSIGNARYSVSAFDKVVDMPHVLGRIWRDPDRSTALRSRRHGPKLHGEIMETETRISVRAQGVRTNPAR
jgi:hypothetical protein